MRCRPVSIAVGILVLSISSLLVRAQTVAEPPIVVNGQCTAESHIAEGAIGDDLTKRQSRFFCDSAVITVFGENKFPKNVMVQFVETKSTHDPQIGYAGQMDDENILNVFNVYLEAGRPPSKASDGACKFFYNGDALSSMACGAKIDEAGRRTVPIVVFNAAQSNTGTPPSASQSIPPTAPTLGTKGRTPKDVADETADQLKACAASNVEPDKSLLQKIELAKEKCRGQITEFIHACQTFFLSIGHTGEYCDVNAMNVIQSASETASHSSAAVAAPGMIYSVFVCPPYAAPHCDILKVNGEPVFYQSINDCKSAAAALNTKSPIKFWTCMAKSATPSWQPAQ
jgi:hypothetical protein